MGSSILIAFVVLVALVLIGFGAGIAAVPLLLIAVSLPAIAALGRRYLKTKRVRRLHGAQERSGRRHPRPHRQGTADEPDPRPGGLKRATGRVRGRGILALKLAFVALVLDWV